MADDPAATLLRLAGLPAVQLWLLGLALAMRRDDRADRG